MGQIFISYSHKDKEYVLQLKKALDEHGFRAWIDDGVETGTLWRREIQVQLEKCQALVVVMTPNAELSDYVQGELTQARKLGKKIFPLLLEGDVWWDFSHIQYEDVRNCAMPTTKFFMRLAEVAPRDQEREVYAVAPAPAPVTQNIFNVGGDFNGNVTNGNGNTIQNTVKPKDGAPTPRKTPRKPRVKPASDTKETPAPQAAANPQPDSRINHPDVPQELAELQRPPRHKITDSKWFVPIVVALIGFAGTICAASIAALPWGQWFAPMSALTPTITLVLPTSTVSSTETPALNDLPTPGGEVPTLTPGITPASTNDKGASMRLVPAGEFTMGGDADAASADCKKFRTDKCERELYTDEEPIHTVFLDAYYMDVYEVTNALYKTCVDAGKCTPPHETKSETRPSYYGDSSFDNYPVIDVDFSQAKAYCEWRGARLPTESEWEKAARGTDARKYPWGSTVVGNQLNSCDRNCPNSWKYVIYNDAYADTAPVDGFVAGLSPYDLYNMAGNVWEWVDGWYDAYAGNTVSDAHFGTRFRIMRGGGWGNHASDTRAARRFYLKESAYRSDLGLRCARSVP